MSWYDIKVPKNIIARPVDTVSYYAIQKETKTSHLNAACYAGHMANLTKYAFDCIPCNTTTSILPPEDFFLWMKFCTAFGFSPPDTMPYVKENMNCCIINGIGDCKHRVYAGLCCYRWAECLSPMVYEACRLIERRPDISFYRIMHYVMGKYVTLIGHSFTNVCAASMSLYGYLGSGNKTIAPRLDLMWGLILKYFFESGTNMAAKVNQTNMTQTIIQSEIAKTSLWLPVKKHEDLLDDKWIDLFTMSNDYEEIKIYYDLNK